MASPKVSIIIPVYNSETSLQTCLDSAIQQTLNDIEVICVDDCSTDSSSKILHSFSDEDKRARIIKHTANQGEGAARNTGLDNANGEYIFHLDADDTIPLDAMEKLYKVAHGHKSDMAKGRYDLIYSDGEIQQQLWSATENIIINTSIDESKFLQQIPTSHCTYLYKRQFLDRYNIRYRTDLVVGLDLIALTTALTHASTVTLIPDLVYYYHQSEDSVTRGKISAKIAKDAIQSKKIVSDILKARGLHDAANERLQKWKFIIDTFFREMPTSLTREESGETFSDFRSLISEYSLVPWMADTQHHYRYTLALIIAGKDEEALSFLRTKNASEGFSDQEELKEHLNFVMQHVPGDLGASIELGRIARKEDKLEDALNIFNKILREYPDNFDAQLQAAGTLIQLGEYGNARDKLDTTLEQLTKGLDFHRQMKNAATLKEHLAKSESSSKIEAVRSKIDTIRSDLKNANTELIKSRTEQTKASNQLSAVRNELNNVREELESVYASTSWRVTSPLRKLMASIKRLT